MRSLLEIREQIKRIFSYYEFAIVPVLKFMLAFLTLSMVSGEMGYMHQLDNLGLVLIASLMCSFLPNGFIILFAVVISLAHMYALSLEVAIVGFAIYLILFLLFFRFSAKDSLVVIFTALCSAVGIPCVIPVAVGLLTGPDVIFAVACGLIGYHMLHHVVVNAPAINAMGDEEVTAKVRMVIDGILKNKDLLIMIIAFSVTIIVVYIIRRLSVEYSWTIAMITGVILNLVILLVGDLIYDTNIALGGAVLGSVLAVVLGKILEFFRFSVDYSRVENVQFEDDEYYYYVKAIPKMTVTAPAKTVKTINVQRQVPGSERNVVTERTSASRESRLRNEHISSGRSVTIGKRELSDDTQIIFEDLDEDN